MTMDPSLIKFRPPCAYLVSKSRRDVPSVPNRTQIRAPVSRKCKEDTNAREKQ